MHCIVLYAQNGDRIVTIDTVTSLHTMYTAANAAEVSSAKLDFGHFRSSEQHTAACI